jgi:hypothetical protein
MVCNDLAVVIYLLWGYLGAASLAGLAALFFLIALTCWLTAKSKKYQVCDQFTVKMDI